MNDIATLTDLLTRGGLVTALILALVGGMRGWYVWGITHEKIVKDRDARIAQLEQEKKDALEKTERDRDLAVAKVDKDRAYWQHVALRALTTGERALDIVDTKSKSKE